ncbi:putative membrane protein [Serinicoccus hydrothermalis]|uniref:Putative membrane protein n=1 Tax=Serinicoccus hydrothermalis TaxID=1758689 RepID=A0A1B1NC65_9MICO|nr:ABC transporter permease [Serinicoccus hydrothermalis]ANS79029.1 putative membrane protein [Serinicoccus hydrothermalis]
MRWASFARARARASAGLLLTLLALVVVTTAIIAGTVGYSTAAASTAARAALSQGEPTETGVQVQTRLAEDPQRQDELARRTIADAFAPAPVSIGRLVVSEPRPAQLDGTVLDGELVVTGGPDLATGGTAPAGLVTVVDGTWPDGDGDGTPDAPTQGALHVGTAQAWDVEVGDVLVVADRAVEVSATWQPVDAQDAFWFGDELVRTGVADEDATLGPVVVDEALAQQVGAPFVRWPVRPDADAITPDDLSVLASGAENLRSELRDVEGLTVRGVQVEGDLAPTAGQAATNLATARALGVVPLSVLVLVTGLAVVQLARLLATTREPQAQLLVARGATRRQLLLSTLAESLVVTVLGAAVGTLLARLGLLLVPGSEGATARVVAAGALTLLGVALVLTAVAWLQAGRLAGGQAIADRSGRARAATALATLVLVLGAAALSWWQLRRAGSPLTRAEDGTLGTDLVAGAAPALLLAAAAVVAVALLGPLSRAVELLTRRTRTTAAHLSSAQVSRRLPVYAVPAVLTVLAVGSTTLAALYSGTSAQLRDDLAAVGEGAPLRADVVRPPATVEPGVVPDPPPDLAELPEIGAAALVWSEPDARVGDVPVPLMLAPTSTDGGLAQVANVPQGIPGGLVPTGLDEVLDAEGDHLADEVITVPEGATEVSIELRAERGVDRWELARLDGIAQTEQEIADQVAELESETSTDDEPPPEGEEQPPAELSEEMLLDRVESEVAAVAAPVEVGLTVLVEDVRTGMTSSVDTTTVELPGPRLSYDPATLDDFAAEPARTSATLTLTLPEGRQHRLRAVTLHLPEPYPSDAPAEFVFTNSSTTLELDLSMRAEGVDLLADTGEWGSTDALTAAQAAPLAEEAAAVEEASVETTVEVERGYVGDEGPAVSTFTESNEPLVPAWLDTSGATWHLEVQDSTTGPSRLVVAPGVEPPDLTGKVPGPGPGAGPEQATSSSAVVPVALTRQAAAAADLAEGDPMTLSLVGTTVPARVEAVVTALPGQQGETAALADSRVASLVLAEQQRSLTWPTQVWAAPSGDTQQAVDALTARDDLRAVTGPGTVSVTDATSAARLVFWVASAGALLLALTGIAAVAATLLSSRRSEVAVLRALGMPPAQQSRSRAMELVGVVAAAIAFGLLAGWLVGQAVVPELASSTTQPGRLRLPAALRLEAAPWGAVVALTAAGAVLLAWLLGSRVRAQALDRTYREEIR